MKRTLHRKGLLQRQNKGWLYILPWMLGLLAFKAYPFLISLYYSFTDYNLWTGISKYGFDNYVEIFHDKKITDAFAVTFRYAFLTVPCKLVFALFIAYILNFDIKGVKWFRIIFHPFWVVLWQ